jgi:signal transduction histidine kinase
VTTPSRSEASPAAELERLAQDRSELLELQTATSEVLEAIGRPGNELEPIFETVVRHSMRLCRADTGIIFTHEQDHYRLAWVSGGSEEYRSELAAREVPLGRGTLVGRVGLERRPVLLPDVLTDPDYEWTEAQRLGRFRTIIGVPMLSQGEVIGVISLSREVVDPFTPREIEVATTFAAQGAIAIRNNNLMQQLELRTQELARSVDELEGLRQVGEAVSASLDPHEVLSTIITHAVQLSGTEGGSIFEYHDDAQAFEIRAAFGTSEELLSALRATRFGLRDTHVGRAALTHAPVAVPDIADAPADAHLSALARHGWRSMLAVPLVREDRILGAFVVRRRTPGTFPQPTVELVETFAGQSALAIQNARLFQELARKSQELEVASRHKSEFLANMSHELRTPLNAVIGFSDVLLDRLFGDLNPKQEEYLHEIRQSGRHLLELLNDILDLSKVEAGKMQLELERTSLRDSLENGISMVSERASRQGLSLSLDVRDDVDEVVADPLRLKQVILNLLTNAVKFTPSGGHIDTSAERVADEIHVSVKDSGVGIAEGDQVRIFEAFQQGRRDISASAEGTGLGLTLSRQIIELHGGRLWVDSRLGEGSTFTFAIPDAPSESAGAH